MAKRSEVLDGAVVPLEIAIGTVTRRRFLQGLVALGASISIPVAIEEASAAQVEQAWARAVADPWYFEISGWGSIVEPGIRTPEFRSDVFDVWDRMPRDPEHLIREVEQLPPLVTAFQGLASDERDDLEHQLVWLDDFDEDDGTESQLAERKRLERLIAEIADPDEGWMAWIRHEGSAGIDQFWEFIEQWLDEPINWDESDWFPVGWHGQGSAYLFFRDMDRDVCAALGVVIVEGDRPGSDYLAAELRKPVEDANAVAARLELPFRFRSEGVRS